MKEEHEVIERFVADLKEWKIKREKEEKIVKRLSVELESLTKELEHVTSFQDIKELKQEDFKPSVQLEVCWTLNGMFQRMFSKLVTLTGDLGRCDNPCLIEKVRDFTTGVRSEYSDLHERIERLVKNAAELTEEERVKLNSLKKTRAGQNTQMQQMEKMFATIFRQHWKQVTN